MMPNVTTHCEGCEEVGCSISRAGTAMLKDAVAILGRRPMRATCTLLGLSSGVQHHLMLHVQGGLATVAVAVRSRNLLATAFHPELAEDLRWYAKCTRFASMKVAHDVQFGRSHSSRQTWSVRVMHARVHERVYVCHNL